LAIYSLKAILKVKVLNSIFKNIFHGQISTKFKEKLLNIYTW